MGLSSGLAAVALRSIALTVALTVGVVPQAAAQGGRTARQAGHGLSLADAVRTAIASDADLYIAREDARDAADGIALARAVFGTRLFGEVSGTRNDQPPTATSFAAVDTIEAASFGIAGRIETGLTYRIS